MDGEKQSSLEDGFSGEWRANARWTEASKLPSLLEAQGLWLLLSTQIKRAPSMVSVLIETWPVASQ